MDLDKINQKTKNFITDVIKVSEYNVGCDGGIDFGHPLVYLNLRKKGYAICPYCSKKYVFKKK